MILFVGRTAAGDYIVRDPAGDYYFGTPANYATRHYDNGSSCGDTVVYPKGDTVITPQEDIKQYLTRRERSKDKSGNTVIKLVRGVLQGKTITLEETTNIDEAAPRSAVAVSLAPQPKSVQAAVPQSGAVPEGLLVYGWFSGPASRPFQLWLEDSQGRRTGWLPDAGPTDQIEEIPNSHAALESLSPSDPDQLVDDNSDPGTWPYAVMVSDATDLENNLRIMVQGSEDADYSLEILRLTMAR